MTEQTKQWIHKCLAENGGDRERLARWLAGTLRIAGLRTCRALIADATKAAA